MDLNLQIIDMAGYAPAHSAVNVNFIAAIRNQLRKSTSYSTEKLYTGDSFRGIQIR